MATANLYVTQVLALGMACDIELGTSLGLFGNIMVRTV